MAKERYPMLQYHDVDMVFHLDLWEGVSAIIKELEIRETVLSTNVLEEWILLEDKDEDNFLESL